MDKPTKVYYEHRFRTQFLEAKGAAFQELFVAIMSKAHGGDFMPCRPWGAVGDRKNDGYLKSERTLFQVYAPNEVKVSQTTAKIREDFTEALLHWKEHFDTWVFVHNASSGFPPQVITALLDLKKPHTAFKVTAWGYDELLLQFRRLSLDAMCSLYGSPPQPGPNKRKVNRNIPFLRNPYFTDHGNGLLKMRRELRNRRVIALVGLPGSGKTQAAVEYRYRYGKAYDCIFWCSAASRETLLSDYARIGALLRLPESRSQAMHVRQWFETNKQWLLVLDNADDPTAISDLIPSPETGHVLLTTQAPTVSEIAHPIKVVPMTRNESVRFLLKRVGLRTPNKQDRASAVELSKTLGYLPLSLAQAGAYIEFCHSSLAEYLDLYKSEGSRLRARRYGGGKYPVKRTFSLAFDKIASANAAAGDLIRACAFYPPDSIPEESFTGGAMAGLGESLRALGDDRLAFGDLLKLAGRLIGRNADGKTLNNSSSCPSCSEGSDGQAGKKVGRRRLTNGCKFFSKRGQSKLAKIRAL